MEHRLDSTVAEEFIAREGSASELLRKSLEFAPWTLVSVALHVLLFCTLALIALGGPPPSVDTLITMEPDQSPTPVATVEDTLMPSSEPLPTDDPVYTPADPIDPDVEPDNFPDDPTTAEPAPPNEPGAIGPGAGHPEGRYGPRSHPGGGKGNNGKPIPPVVFPPVDSGLKWLADHQEADGHWDTKRWGGNGDYDPGICGLALLAFAGCGHTERSGKYTRVVRKAIDWLASQQDTKGNFAPHTTMYSHAIPTLALLEEAAMAPVPRTMAIAKKGLDYMISVQNDYKAWRYWPKDNDNDMSVTAWCVMALKAAKVAGLDVSAGSWAGVKNFLDEVTEPNYGEVGYASRPVRGATEQPYQRYSMTACGMLCRLYMGVSREDRLIKNGTIILLENLPEWNQPGIGAQFYYYWYYGALVAFQVEGELWKRWEDKMLKVIVPHQRMEEGDLKGSWDPAPSTHFSQMGGRVYSTAMAVLTLSVYWRYEIIAKAAGKKK